MKVSLNLVKQYTDVDVPADELVGKINQQLGAAEEVTELGPRYRGATIAKIVSCEDHPNADRLHVCRIDDGGVTQGVERDGDGLVQVVCGAPNARAGIMVVWLPPGSTVPASFGDAEPFVLSVRPLRGMASNGMLASPRELGIGDSHEGILEIDPSTDVLPGSMESVKPGASFAEVFGLDDTIIDIENKMFTHRPDCFGLIGVAREIAGIQGKPFKSPDWYADTPQFKEGDGSLKLEVRNEASEVVPHFMAVAIQGIAVKPSPLWLQIELVRMGSRPINNIVDVTNYIMLLTGQPLHAYDYDKVAAGEKGAVLGVRQATDGEQIALLNGKTVKLTPDDVIITDGTRPIGLGGVMGGADTEVSTTTTTIILECANFDMYAIRKTSMRHGLFTDAVTRFNKGQSPLQNPHVLNLAVMSVHDVAEGAQASRVVDIVSGSTEVPAVAATVEFINVRLGLHLSGDEMAALLRNVEFDVEVVAEKLRVTPPFWRTDIELPEDVVEEVGRLYGFDKLPRELPQRSIKPAPKNGLVTLKHAVREQLARLGANEVLTYSFVHENILKRAGQNPELAYRLGNALSPDLQYYRLSLTPSLLDKVHANLKAGYDEFALFEFGKAHTTAEVDEDGLPKEFDHLAMVIAVSDKAAANRPGAPYYAARGYVEQLLGDSSAGEYELRPLDSVSFEGHVLTEQMAQPFTPNRSAAVMRDGRIVGVVGEYKAAVAKAFKLPKYAAGFELCMSVLLAHGRLAQYRTLPRFPKVWQDVSLRVPRSVAYGDLYSEARQVLDTAEQSENILSSLESISIYQATDDSKHKNITLRYTVASYDKTMTDAEVSRLLDNVVRAATEKFAAERI